MIYIYIVSNIGVSNKRLVSVQLLNRDRVVDFQFGSGDSCAHLLLELYASGNIILTDHQMRMEAVLRNYEYQNTMDSSATVRVAVGELYPMIFATQTQTQLEQQHQHQQEGNDQDKGRMLLTFVETWVEEDQRRRKEEEEEEKKKK